MTNACKRTKDSIWGLVVTRKWRKSCNLFQCKLQSKVRWVRLAYPTLETLASWTAVFNAYPTLSPWLTISWEGILKNKLIWSIRLARKENLPKPMLSSLNRCGVTPIQPSLLTTSKMPSAQSIPCFLATLSMTLNNFSHSSSMVFMKIWTESIKNQPFNLSTVTEGPTTLSLLKAGSLTQKEISPSLSIWWLANIDPRWLVQIAIVNPSLLILLSQ